MPTTTYLWDSVSDNVLSEDDGTTTVFTSEPSEFGDLVSQYRGINTNFYGFDASGDTRGLTDSSENVSDTRLYDAWGNIVSATGPTKLSFQFVGKLGYIYDGSFQSTYSRARWYSSTSARWFSVGASALPSYSYNENNTTLLQHPIARSSKSPGYQAAANSVPVTLTVTPVPPRRLVPRCLNVRAEASFIFSLNRWPCRGDQGYMIQQVRFHCHIANCNEGIPDEQQSLTYYEAWPVSRGRVRVRDTAKLNQDGGRGRYHQNGDIRFYCLSPDGVAQAGEITSAETSSPGAQVFGSGRCRTSTVALHATQEKPGFWSRDGVANSGRRRFGVTWNCCCPKKFADAFAKP